MNSRLIFGSSTGIGGLTNVNQSQGYYTAQAQQNAWMQSQLSSQLGGVNQVQPAPILGHTLEWMADMIIAKVAAANHQLDIEAIRKVVREELDHGEPPIKAVKHGEGW